MPDPFLALHGYALHGYALQDVEGALVKAAHWHPSRSDDPALTWLRDLIAEAALLSGGGDPVPPVGAA